MRSRFKAYKLNIKVAIFCLLFLLSATLLINKVGMSRDSNYYEEVDGLCRIDLASWYVNFTMIVGLKLLVVIGRYYCLKENRKESITLTLFDSIVIQLLFTGLFL